MSGEFLRALPRTFGLDGDETGLTGFDTDEPFPALVFHVRHRVTLGFVWVPDGQLKSAKKKMDDRS
jgi:hypothetical protein